MATGRYCHDIRSWDNAFPYIGGARSWGHRLTANGHRVATIGKLHFRSPDDGTGFPEQHIPMHVLEGVGDLYSLIRHDMAARPAMRQKILEARAGESEYTRYDRAIATTAGRWLREEASGETSRWALFVSFVTPHHPLIAPEEFAAMYPPDDVIFPSQYHEDERPHHPVLDEFRRVFAIDGEFDEADVRRAVAMYYGLCSFMDNQVGQVLMALEEAGLTQNTRIIYSSDHGDTIGDHGLWWKHTMYEGSAGAPLIMAGPEIPEGRVVEANTSLVDCFPTILESVGVSPEPADADLPGTSLFDYVADEQPSPRPVFSEYHAAGALTGYFMLRGERYKYVEYVDFAPQRYDLDADPEELTDLAADPGYTDVIDACADELRKICDPADVHQLALADQKEKIESHGGEEAVRATGLRIPFTPAPAEFRES